MVLPPPAPSGLGGQCTLNSIWQEGTLHTKGELYETHFFRSSWSRSVARLLIPALRTDRILLAHWE